MAYKKKELEKLALEAIKTNNLFFIADLVAYLPISRQAFYQKGLDKLDSIKAALDDNKINTKNGLRKKWYKSDNPTMTVALYKLIGDDDERKKLSQQYSDITSDGEKIEPVVIFRPEKLEDDV